MPRAAQTEAETARAPTRRARQTPRPRVPTSAAGGRLPPRKLNVLAAWLSSFSPEKVRVGAGPKQNELLVANLVDQQSIRPYMRLPQVPFLTGQLVRSSRPRQSLAGCEALHH